MSEPSRLHAISAVAVHEAFHQMGHQVEGQIDDHGSGSGALFFDAATCVCIGDLCDSNPYLGS
jgi:hypothetical protein